MIKATAERKRQLPVSFTSLSCQRLGQVDTASHHDTPGVSQPTCEPQPSTDLCQNSCFCLHWSWEGVGRCHEAPENGVPRQHGRQSCGPCRHAPRSRLHRGPRAAQPVQQRVQAEHHAGGGAHMVAAPCQGMCRCRSLTCSLAAYPGANPALCLSRCRRSFKLGPLTLPTLLLPASGHLSRRTAALLRTAHRRGVARLRRCLCRYRPSNSQGAPACSGAGAISPGAVCGRLAAAPGAALRPQPAWQAVTCVAQPHSAGPLPALQPHAHHQPHRYVLCVGNVENVVAGISSACVASLAS